MKSHVTATRLMFASILVCAATSTLAARPALADSPPQHDHLALAQFYIDDIDPGSSGDNSYGGDFGTSDPPRLATVPDSIFFSEPHHTESRTRCGSFLALLLKQAHPSLDEGDNGGDVLFHMAGSTSPSASVWHDAIELEASYDEPNDGLSNPYYFERRLSVGQIQPGDILAAEYSNSSPASSGDVTGHAMLVESIHIKAAGEDGGPSLLGTVQYIVSVIDSSSGIHGMDDTRNVSPWGNGNSGIGQGTIVLYRDLLTGVFSGWTWSVNASVVYTQSQRHMVAGRLHGPATGL